MNTTIYTMHRNNVGEINENNEKMNYYYHHRITVKFQYTIITLPDSRSFVPSTT